MLAYGFADPVHDGQRTFRAVLDALARPGTVQPLFLGLAPPAPLTPELAAVALALADADAALWLDAPLRGEPAVADFLRFHTGAPIVDDPAEAAFALVWDPLRCPALEAFAQGTLAYPDRSTTLVIALSDLSTGAGWRLAGPGIRGEASLSARPLPADLVAQLAGNRAAFPCGVDLVLTAPGRVVGLPRSIRVTEG